MIMLFLKKPKLGWTEDPLSLMVTSHCSDAPDFMRLPNFVNPVIARMTIQQENLSILEVELPVAAEEDHSIKAILQDSVLEVILERDLRIRIDLKIDPGIIPRNHIIDPESNLRNVIDLGTCHHDPKNLIIICLGISFPEIVKIYLID